MSRIRSPRNLVIAIVAAAAIAYLFMPRTESWQEEVRLSNGSHLVIDRTLTYGGRAEIGQGSPISGWTITFKHPGSGERVTFEAPGGVELVLLDVYQDTLYLAGRAVRGDAIHALKCPNPPFIFYRYSKGWQQVSAKEFPAGFTRANLPLHTVERNRLANAGKLISASEIKAINEDRGLGPNATVIWTTPIATSSRDSICARPA